MKVIPSGQKVFQWVETLDSVFRWKEIPPNNALAYACAPVIWLIC